MIKKINNLKGFTAAEIITVVAIISILALIVIPKFWNRTEQARISAATEDMARIADAESLCYADTGSYVALGNLHGTEPASSGYTVVTAWSFSNWSTYFGGTNGQFSNLSVGFVISTVKNWNGPYIVYQPSQMLDETSFTPLDPWKNPYIFYGPVTVSPTDPSISSKIRLWSEGPNLQFDGTGLYLPWGQQSPQSPAAGDDILYIR